MDFVETEISEIRIKNSEYMDGKTKLGYEEGRSRVVSSKVRDTIGQCQAVNHACVYEHGQAC